MSPDLNKSFPVSRRIAVFGPGPLPHAGSDSAPGVANRCWHFMQPALAGGAECLFVSLENGAVPIAPGAEPVEEREGDLAWRTIRIETEALKQTGALEAVLARFDPEVLVSAGSLLPAAGACRVAGDRPVWCDFFGDPMAEIRAKAGVLGDEFSRDEELDVWRLMAVVLRRADAFSTVSHRQIDALRGELALFGRLDSPAEPPAFAMPCSLERHDLFEPRREAEYVDWRTGHGMPAGALVALRSGGFNAWDDPETLVAGLELAMDRIPNLYLVTTGGGLPGFLGRVYERFQAVARSSRHSGRILDLGWLDLARANQWCRLADLAVMTDRPCGETRWGARNRLLYHAAAGCPVVATSGTEAVEEMAEAGALRAVPAGDPDALAAAIVHLESQPSDAQRVAEAARLFCIMNYTFEVTSRSYLAFLADPRRCSAPAPESAHAHMDWYLDIGRRCRDFDELDKYRSNSLTRRLKRLFD